jgi:hypothetical protein
MMEVILSILCCITLALCYGIYFLHCKLEKLRSGFLHLCSASNTICDTLAKLNQADLELKNTLAASLEGCIRRDEMQ